MHEVDPSVLVCIMCWTMQQVALTFPHIRTQILLLPKDHISYSQPLYLPCFLGYAAQSPLFPP